MKIMSTFPRRVFEVAGIDKAETDKIGFAPFKTDAFFELLTEADCLFTSSLFDITEEIIETGKKLKLIQTMGVGYDKIALAFAAGRNIYVCNNKAANSVAVAEHALGLMLAGLKRMSYYERRVFTGEFAAAVKESFVAGLHQLSSRRVGIVGFGDIAKTLAGLLRAFGCEVYYYNRTRAGTEVEKELNVTYLPFAELLKTCNVISLHVPSAPNTINLIGKAEFDLMPKDTLLINTARGEVVDTQAMIDAIAEGRLFGAAVDTTSPEPPPADHPYFSLPAEVRDRLIVTPHTAGATAESLNNSLNGLLYNAGCVAEGKRPKNVVNGLQ